ncbi:MAG: hypothetical protein GOV02_00570 [Candidatus Aenigmarchaeota archaeon]|nr:hypothetical protein [Candidatus Aenigmarchaeota archaeon]
MVKPVKKKDTELPWKYTVGLLAYVTGGLIVGYTAYQLLYEGQVSNVIPGVVGAATCFYIGKKVYPRI